MRWGEELARIEARVGRPETPPEARDTVEVALVAAREPAAPGSGSASTASRVVPPALAGVLRTVLFAPEEMLLVAGSPSLRREALDRLAGQRSPAYVRELATYGRALQQRNGLLRAIREEQATRAELRFWDQTVPRVRVGRPRGAPAAAHAPRRTARRRARARSPPRRRRPSRSAWRTRRTRPQHPGESVAGRAGAPPRGDRREGGLERHDAHRAPPRRPRVRDGRPADGVVRLARAAADGDPRVQARGARPADGARRPAAAPAPRRRVQRARPGAPGPPRPADRGAAPGVRHDDDARRHRPGAARASARPGR